MASCQAIQNIQNIQNIQKAEQQRSVPKDEKAQGIKKAVSSRNSACIEERTISKDRNTELTLLLPSPKNNNLSKESLPAPLRNKERKQKQAHSPEELRIYTPTQHPRKRRQASIIGAAVKDICDREKTNGSNDKSPDPIDYWRATGRWPKQYFRQDDQIRKDFTNGFKKGSSYEKNWISEMHMNHLLAKRKSLSSSLRGKQLEGDSGAPTSSQPREAKSAPYQTLQYKFLLEAKGSFMRKSDLDIADTSKTVCRILCEAEQIVPEDSLFQDDIFDETCKMIEERNETKVIQDIARLIVPSAESLAVRGAKHLKILIESVNEGWDSSIALAKPRPQPDYAVGFKRTTFTEDQLKKIQPFIGGFSETSFFISTFYMYFPFLTCEVKCAAGTLEVADRQNAHSMTLAVRGIVELFRLVKREKELHREILAFSISHNDRTVRIYGHYPVIDGEKTTFYRHPINEFIFTSEDGRNKWTSYKFTKSVYDIWMPTHLKRICSAIDDLPLDINFDVLTQSEPGGSGPSYLGQSSHGAASLEEGSQSSRVGSRDVTPHTSLSQRIDERAFKKPKKGLDP